MHVCACGGGYMHVCACRRPTCVCMHVGGGRTCVHVGGGGEHGTCTATWDGTLTCFTA